MRERDRQYDIERHLSQTHANLTIRNNGRHLTFDRLQTTRLE